MKKNGIVVKMTIVTFVFFVLFIGGAFLFEGTFFESFYLKKKIESMDKSISSFSDRYIRSDWDSQELKDNISLFNNENGAELTLLDDHGNIKDENVYSIIIEADNGVLHKIHLNHILTGTSNRILTLRYNEYISAYGFSWTGDKDIFKPLLIESSNTEIVSNISIEDKYKYEKISGRIVGLDLPEYYEMKSAFYRQPIREVVLDFMINYGNRYRYLTRSGKYEKVLNEGDYKSMVFYYPLGNGEVIFVLESQRNIIEAKDILSDYHFYILIFSFVLVIFLSYFYSFILLKPLLNINDIAARMAKLDFSKKISINRNDEIGNLSESLNTLSTNLSNNIEELKDTNAQLTIEIKKERHLENMRKEFVSGVSHELKTPLGIIRGFAEGIKDDVFEDTNYYLDVIIEETEKMDVLIVDMLELSRLESANYKINKDYFDIYILVEFVKNKFEYSFKEKELYVEVNKNCEDVICYGDRVRMEQVLVNFISNAIRHSKYNGKITIDLDNELGYVKISIENTGDNIPDEKLNKVWHRFYRVDESRSKSDGGTGLGLSIVKNILDLHGSSYGVRNTKKGVSFYFLVQKENI